MDDESSLVIDKCILQNNAAKTDGGAIAITEGSELTIQDSIIKKNSGDRGGGIYVGKIPWKSVTLASNITMSHNTAHRGGGGIFVFNAGSLSTGLELCPGCIYIENSAAYGPNYGTMPYKLHVITAIPELLSPLTPVDVQV